jgi:hypothetical protein
MTKKQKSAMQTDLKYIQWVKTWKRAGHALKEIKKQELRSYDYKQHQPMVDEMLRWACDHQKERITSGLVDQQRLFVKLVERRRQ